MNIFVDRKVLAKFRRRALRRYPNEYIEAIYGVSNRSGGLSIVEFRPVEHEATADSVKFDAEETAFGTRDGKLTILGTIHTHPDLSYCEPSEEDWEDSGARNELIMGIMAIPTQVAGQPKRKSRIKFFFARALCNMRIT